MTQINITQDTLIDPTKWANFNKMVEKYNDLHQNILDRMEIIAEMIDQDKRKASIRSYVDRTTMAMEDFELLANRMLKMIKQDVGQTNLHANFEAMKDIFAKREEDWFKFLAEKDANELQQSSSKSNEQPSSEDEDEDNAAKTASEIAVLDSAEKKANADHSVGLGRRAIEIERAKAELEAEMVKLHAEKCLKVQELQEQLENLRLDGFERRNEYAAKRRQLTSSATPVFDYPLANETMGHFQTYSQHARNIDGENEHQTGRADRGPLEPTSSRSGAGFSQMQANQQLNNAYLGHMNFIPSSQNFAARSFERCLPKWQLSQFSGDPLQWPEWSSMFLSTVDKSPISDDEKMNHLKTLLTGRAKDSVAGMGYSGVYYDQAWQTLQTLFGRPQLIVDCQLSKLRNWAPVKIHDSYSIVAYSTLISNVVNVLTNMKYTSDLNSSANLNLALSKLPINLKEQWLTHVATEAIAQPNLTQFNKWLATKALVHDYLSGSHSNAKPGNPKQKGSSFVSEPKTNVNEKPSTKPDVCVLQDGIHKLWNCTVFKKQTIDERMEVAKKHRLCFGCFSKEHSAKDCQIKPCGIDGCTRKHNRMLHNKSPPVKKEQNVDSQIGSNASTADEPDAAFVSKCRGILPIVPVQIKFHNSHMECLALCDTGSTITWIDESVKRKIWLSGKKTSLNVAGINGVSDIATEVVKVGVGKPGGKGEQIEAYINNINVGDDTYDLWEYKERFLHLDVLPSTIYRLKDVKVILGQNCYHLIRPLEYRKNGRDKPWAVNTELGWMLSGPLPRREQAQLAVSSHYAAADNEGLAAQLKSWWSMESYKTNVDVLSRSAEDKRAMQILEKSTRLVDNRYEVGLLWAEDGIEMPNNFCTAASQFYSLEKRLEKDPELQNSYQRTIDDDLEKGFIRKITPEEIQETKHDSQWYLPHHPVLNPNKPGKVRRVCNAASKYKDVSLNDKLLTGPDLLQNLIGILWRFREEAVAIAADIQSMFLQVAVPKEDAKHLRFLWRSKPEEKLTVYEYNRHIFGAKSSPACALYALQRTAKDNANEFPIASAIVLRNIYMDDLLKSVATTTEATRLIVRLNELLKKGGFEFKKWISNNKEVATLDGEGPDRTLTEENSTSVLGCEWSLTEDTLQICRGIDRQLPEKITQRVVLSFVSAVFDPMGLAAPFTVNMRLLLKAIWQKVGQNWDEEIPTNESNAFKDWFQQAKQLAEISIPRFYKHDPGDSVTLHIFCDASLDAMGIVAYFRFGSTEQETENVSFIIGKARVAPLKQLSIPKLELQAALFAARMKEAIISEHDLQIDKVWMWTDSTTVVQWLTSMHKKQPVFVANRTAEILDLTTIDQWHHVPGTDNPADIATRGISADSLRQSVWLTGPAWLRQPESSWPIGQLKASQDPTESVMVTSSKIMEPPIDWSRFSNWKRLLRTVALIVKCFRSKSFKFSPLSITDLQQAEQAIWRLVQRESFTTEYKDLIDGDNVKPNSKIHSLTPFMDENGTMRAKGRLSNSNLSYEAKHPIILPKRHHVIDIFLRYKHDEFHHEGVEFLRAQLQQKYWIVNLRSKLRQIKLACLSCRKYKAKTMSPFMADLPSERVVQPMHPFTNVGIDYFGPFLVKIHRKIHKRWCCLFTCLATRAVHIEIAETLDTDSCMNCIVRFMARRGKPHKFISDNGTNFVGAATKLKDYIKSWNKSQMEDELKQQHIEWQFNPPSSPHFGGVWERLVRSCKKSMYFILGNRSLTPEVLQTVMAMVEQNLNSRPITPNSSDVNDLEALTPNHFLLGTPNVSLSYIPDAGNFTNHRKTFKQAQAFIDHIWQRWMKEYVPLLTQRKVWNQAGSADPKIGDLVWLVDSSDKRGHYPLARILDTYPGKDGHIRSVKLRTTKGTYVRPTVKLAPVFDECVLPPEEHGAGDVGACAN